MVESAILQIDMERPITNTFRWMTDKEISKIDSAKYKENGKKGLILEVDLEYPRELHSLHNDYPVAPRKIKGIEWYAI